MSASALINGYVCLTPTYEEASLIDSDYYRPEPGSSPEELLLVSYGESLTCICDEASHEKY